MNSEQMNLWNEKYDEVCLLMKKVMDEMKEKGIRINIQTRTLVADEKYITLNMTTMGAVDCLGSLEHAKLTAISGLQSHQGFDSFVQAMEARPDLMKRFTDSISKAHGN